MRGLERRRDLARDVERLGGRERPFENPFRERPALDELHRDERDGAAPAVGLVDLVDDRDVRVAELRREPGLAQEARRLLHRRRSLSGP